MSSKFALPYVLQSCRGTHLFLHDVPDVDTELWLASLLSEYEAKNIQVVSVTLRIKRKEDTSWLIPALRWFVCSRTFGVNSQLFCSVEGIARANPCE